MLSYHGDKNLKDLLVAKMKKHQEQDQFIRGTYAEMSPEGFKACAIGCAIDSMNKILNKEYHTSDHKVFEKVIGVPEWLARLQDLFFETLPDDINSQFAVDFLEAIPVGINLEPVKWKFCAFLMKENIERIKYKANINEELKQKVLASIRQVLKLYESAINCGILDREEAALAESAAEAAMEETWSAAETGVIASASAASAWSAALAASEALTWSAAEAAVAAAASAAWVAADAAAPSAVARSEAYTLYSKELLRLLKDEDVNV